MFRKPRLIFACATTFIALALAVVIAMFGGGVGRLLHESERLESARARLHGLAAQGTADLIERARVMRLREALGGEVERMAQTWSAKIGDVAEPETAEIMGAYGPLIQKLGLGEEQTEATIRLLAGARSIGSDAAKFAENHGLSMDDPENRRAVEVATAAAMASRFRELLGQDGYGEYIEYESTLDWRLRLRPFNDRLARVSEPMHDSQTEALLEVLASVQLPSRGDSGDLSGIPDDVVDRAAAVLSPRQLQVLKLLQAEQRWSRTMSAVEPNSDFQVPVASSNRSG